jgi:RNA polymerase sigma-70 factor
MSLSASAQRAFFNAIGSTTLKGDSMLIAALGQVLERARRKWPAVTLSDEEFLSRLATRVRESSGVVGMLGRLRTSDLFIAWAAEKRDDAAIAAILEHSHGTLLEALATMRLAPHERDEVLQKLRQRVFVGEKPRIGGYSGTGSLGTWLAAVAVRIAIDGKRAEKPEDELDEQLAAAVADTADVELALIRNQYAGEFAGAFREAFRTLTLDERNLIRLTFIDRLSIDALSTMTGLHRSTVARRIAGLRDELAKGTRKRLQDKFRLTASDVNSLMRVVVSAFDASLGSLLREPGKSRLPSKK